MPHVSLATKWSADRPAFGGWVTGDSEGTIAMFGRLGYDYVGIDTQHSPLNESQAAVLVRRLVDAPFAVLVRVSKNDTALIGRLLDSGADGIIVSTHGGRQLDRAAAPLEVLAPIVDAVGDRANVLLDTGIMHGGDVVAALALGARACLVGRAFLYGLMAGGERGVDRAISILSDEITRTLQLLGVSGVQDLNRSHVSLR